MTINTVQAQTSAILGTPRVRVALSRRDARILRRAEEKLAAGSFDFRDAVCALHESTMEAVPSGRVFLLGYDGDSPVFGSAISGVGIAEQAHGVRVVRISPGRGVGPLRWLRP